MPQICRSTTANDMGTRLGDHAGTLFCLSAIPIFKLLLIDLQHSCEDLLIDGYVSYMFCPQDAKAYFCSLLGRMSLPIQWHVILPGGIFCAAIPPGLQSNQENQESWAIDYTIKDAGSVIPQQIWTSQKLADVQCYVCHEQLHSPIFFVQKDSGSLDISLREAMVGNCLFLQGAQQAAPVRPSSHMQIHINVSSILTFVVWV